MRTPLSTRPSLDRAVADLMRTHHVPGLSLAVVSADRVEHAAGYGYADLETGTPATPDTAYLWFSMSKIVTATAALALADHGALDLDAPMDEYLSFRLPAGAPRPTVRQLLDHTSGLGNPMPLRWVHPAGAAAPDPEELLHRLLGRRRAFRRPPGQEARYTNVGYLALGEVLRVASGLPFEEYARQAVLDPAGMARTGFTHPADGAAATGYVRAPGAAGPLLHALFPRGIVGRRTGPYVALKPFAVDGPAYGGLIGSVLDAGRFLRVHLNDGELDGRRVLAPATAVGMRRIDRPGTPFAHGLGWFRSPGSDGVTRVEHFGAGAGFWNVMRLYPDRGLGVVVMANTTARYDFEPLMRAVLDEVAPAGALV